MPYLHWETAKAYEEMANVIAHLDGESKGDISKVPDRDKRLFGAYLPEKHLHIRRSLDQSYYWTLKDTTKRDKSQIVGKWFRRQNKRRKDREEKTGNKKPEQ